MGFTDTGVPPARTSTVWSSPTRSATSPTRRGPPVTVRRLGDDSAYLKAVYDDQPTNYWRMGESTGTTASADRVGFMPLSAVGTTVPVRGEAGAIANDADTASCLHRCEHQLDGVRSAALGSGRDDPRGLVQDHGPGGRIAGWSTPEHPGQLPEARPAAVHRHRRQAQLRCTSEQPSGSWSPAPTPSTTASGTTRWAACPRTV